MVAKPYEWEHGAVLEDHTARKHKILREYSRQYTIVRCQLPQQTKFRLAIIDGFAGAGRYACGSPGSPIILIEELRSALEVINVGRAVQNLPLVDIECLFIFNDADPAAIELLKERCAPLLAEIKEEAARLHVACHYMTGPFESSYPAMKNLIAQGRYRNVLFNLDQCGYSKVEIETLADIMTATHSAEIFFTFSIEPLLAFLHKRDPLKLARQLRCVGVTNSDLKDIDVLMSHQGWLGAAEKLVFDQFATCARYVSPFSIHNPGGWRYWLIHFANSARARQVYNDILHDNSTSQAHFGRSGLNMLSYDPSEEGALYLFDMSGREAARAQLVEDIPRLITDCGDALGVREFYETIYNATAAHTDDIHTAIMVCEDLEVQTEAGGVRQKANTIDVRDTIRLKAQRTFFPMFLQPK
ncbi:MAG: three-Cys-motif partner protein TcmP [Hyphomonadaceae bacterium]|nr:three-Cys-motif partner protein TcmP [Hyphomonadaceae bacterium]